MFLLIGWLEKKMRKPDYEEKQQPYFRYPRPDPYHGFFDDREKQMDTRQHDGETCHTPESAEEDDP